MTLSDFSIKRPVFAWILMFGLIFFGALSFRQMGINENPDVEFPNLTIRYSYPGATPAVIEKDVLEVVESVLVSMQGIRNMTSNASRGNGRIDLEFELSVDTDFALQEVNTLISRAQRQLPDSLEPPTITKSNADDRPIMYLALATENLSTREIMLLFRDRIQDRLSTVDGVAEVRPFGYHEPMLRIDLNAEKLKQYQLTASDIVASIQREHEELPAGKLEFGDSEDLLRIMGEVSDVEEFRNLIVSRRGGSPNFVPIRLKEVATIYEGLEDTTRISRVNGIPAMGMAIQKQRGVNAVATADRVLERIKEINGFLPEGTTLSVNFDGTQFIRESVNELVFTLVLAAILTSIVCWLFIGSWSATVNILLAIPTAVIGTFIFINWLGFTLNTFSLLGLALAIGVVVDDAIVMLENIVRYVQNGFDRVNAAFKGAREISFAVIATTVALVSIFIPIAFMPGIEGRFFFEFVVTISIAVSLSSLEALTLAPMRCSQFLQLSERRMMVGRAVDNFVGWNRKVYKGALEVVLRNRWKTVFISLVAFVASLGALRFISTEFIPPQDRGVLFLILIAPDGKSLEYTTEKAKEFEKISMNHPDVRRTFVAVGGFGGGGQGNRGNGVIILKDRDKRKLGQEAVAADLREAANAQIQGMRVIIRDRFGSALGGRRGSPVEFTIKGPDLDKQKEIFHDFESKFKDSPLLTGIRSDDTRELPEVHFVPDREKAIARGVEIAEIANIINITFGGVVAAQYTKGGRRFDITVKMNAEDRQQSKDINKILIRNNRGELLPLSSVVNAVQTSGPQEIYRENRARGVRVDASLQKGGRQGDAVKAINAWAESLPEKYSIEFSATPQGKIVDALVIMLLGLIVAYMILASQFNSFIDPLFIFLAIPFGITGALLALWAGGQTLNVYSIIGILLTMGIVKKNSILLVEFANQLRDQGKSVRDALRESCDTRLRPIMMTNFATIAAAIPAVLSFGPGNETRVPMALTVIGGVLVSVFFTLLVVPAVYDLVGAKRHKIVEEG